jgi:hypothetical protein
VNAFGSERYGRHKAIAILVTFALGWLAVRFWAPEWKGSLPWAFADSPRRAFEERRSGVPVRAFGIVEAALPDSSLAAGVAVRWRARTRDGHPFTWLQDPASSAVPAAPGDSLMLRGRYEWDSTGGTVVTGESAGAGQTARVRRNRHS